MSRIDSPALLPESNPVAEGNLRAADHPQAEEIFLRVICVRFWGDDAVRQLAVRAGLTGRHVRALFRGESKVPFAVARVVLGEVMARLSRQ